jgi:hypothetical protein
MTTAYVYKWTHLPTLKWYIGSRTASRCHPDDGYICSAPSVKKMIKANPNEWQRTIVNTGDPELMYDLETEILQLFDARNDMRSFNLHNNTGDFRPPIGTKRPGVGGVKKGNVPWNKGAKETRPEVLERIKIGAQNCDQSNRGMHGNHASALGRKHTPMCEEYRKNRSEHMKRIWAERRAKKEQL